MVLWIASCLSQRPEEKRYFLKMRPSRKELHLKTAFLWAERSLCKQPDSRVGCIITTNDMRQILGFGYNGPVRQLGNSACLNQQGQCGCIHAELNAILKAKSFSLAGQAMFITRSPCIGCARAIAQAGVSKVIYCEQYRLTDGLELLRACEVKIEQMPYPF